MWDLINNNIIFITIISVLIINFLFAHFYVVLCRKNEKANIFVFTHSIVLQTLIVWIVIIVATIVCSIAHNLFFSLIFNSVNSYDLYESLFISVKCILPLFFLCVIFLFVIGKVLHLNKAFSVSILTSLLLACCYAMVLFGYKTNSLFGINIAFYVFLIIYTIYKISIEFQYRYCIKNNSDTKDFRVSSLICAFVALIVGTIIIIPIGLFLGVDSFITNPISNDLLFPIVAIIICFLLGFILNCVLQYYVVFELHKKNNEKESSAMFFIAILTAPYVLLVPIIFLIQAQETAVSIYL